MEELVKDLQERKKRTVLVTGAGLSVASGIPAYRGSGSAVTWSRFVCDWSTKRKFQASPKEWYNVFWFPSTAGMHLARPNAGHHAIARICCLDSVDVVGVITQNIDGLHSRTLKRVPQNRLIEIHGRRDRLRCLTKGCRKEDDGWDLSLINYKQKPVRRQSLRGAPIHTARPPSIDNVPRCSSCKGALVPTALLFDEDYGSHPEHSYAKAMAWLKAADIIVFVGTSFAVGVTAEALKIARQRDATVYNINTDRPSSASMSSRNKSALRAHRITQIRGRAEIILPILRRRLEGTMSKEEAAMALQREVPDEVVALQHAATISAEPDAPRRRMLTRRRVAEQRKSASLSTGTRASKVRKLRH
eukprot:g5454.t1